MVPLGKWQDEKQLFAKSAILFRLEQAGLQKHFDYILPQALPAIEAAANKPIPPSSENVISDPRIFSPTMDPVHFEQFCAFQLQKAGWVTRSTPTTGDQGADILADRGGLTLVVQCKLYSGSVGNDAVQQVIAARQFQKADLAIVASNAPYTPSARQLAGVANVELLHHEELHAYTGPPGSGAISANSQDRFFRSRR